jgi:hypothetical protein
VEWVCALWWSWWDLLVERRRGSTSFVESSSRFLYRKVSGGWQIWFWKGSITFIAGFLVCGVGKWSGPAG